MKINKKLELQELTAFTVFYYLLPIILLSLGYLPFSSRHVVIFFIGIILIAYAIDKNIKPADLGLRKDNLKLSLVLNLAFVVVAILAAILGIWSGLLSKVNYEGTILFAFYYVLISAPIQEFIFRSLMFYELGLFFKNKIAKVLISASIFAFAHAMYHSWQVLAVTFVLGVCLGVIYLKKPNFWGVSLAHALVGIVAIFLGVV